MISFSNNLNKQFYRWTAFKELLNQKEKTINYIVENDHYYLWFVYDDTLVTSVIWFGEVPWAIQTEYSQEQNDLDKLDFEGSYFNG